MSRPASLEPEIAPAQGVPSPTAAGGKGVSRWPVILRAALAQAGALFLSLVLAVSLPLPAGILLVVHSLAATALTGLMRLPWWWWPIQFCFAPAVVATLWLPLPPGAFLAAFLCLALVYGHTWRSRVPLYLSGEAVWQALKGLVPRQGRVLDLGSGLGGPLLYLARHQPGLCCVGIEAAPLPWLLSRLRAWRVPNVQFRLGSFWEEDLGAHDFVFAYLSPAAMPRLWDKVRAEMRPGSVFVSVEFPVPGVRPDAVIDTGGRQRLYLWRF